MAKDNGVVGVLNRIVEHELAGAVRYTQYSLMIFGHARIPIMSWMQQQAQEALAHATQAGEEVTSHGGRVSLGIGKVVGSHHAHGDAVLGERGGDGGRGVAAYGRRVEVVRGQGGSGEGGGG